MPSGQRVDQVNKHARLKRSLGFIRRDVTSHAPRAEIFFFSLLKTWAPDATVPASAPAIPRSIEDSTSLGADT